MPRKKKEKTPQEEPVKTTKSAVDETTPKEKKSESQSATQGEAAERKPREPQMVTVNGDKVTHGHATRARPTRRTGISRQNQRPTVEAAEDGSGRPRRLSAERTHGAAAHGTLLSHQTHAEGARCLLSGGECAARPRGQPTIDKFNVYKETDETRADYGKYKFYAQVGDKKMSTTASREDLNAYFDRVATPGQLVERNFGDRLHLQSHYEQFRLPEGIDPKVSVSQRTRRKSGKCRRPRRRTRTHFPSGAVL